MELKLNEVTLNYFGHADCLHSITHTFTDGVNVVFGNVGSGKTSLLKAIAGINYVHDGSITLDGENITLTKNTSVNMVFDDLAFFERRSLKYNLHYPLKLRKIPVEERNDIIDEWLYKFGVSHYLLDNAAFRLSNEDRVKCALIRAFYRNSKVIVFDNPLACLNPSERRKTFALLAKYMFSTDAIIVYATDSAEEVELLNRPTLVLSYGYNLEIGLPSDFLKKPKCLQTAELFFPFYNKAEVVLNEQGFEFFDCNFVLSLEGTLAESYIGKSVLLGFKPDALIEGEIPAQYMHSLTAPTGNIHLIMISGVEFYSAIDSSFFGLDLDKIALYDKVTERLIYCA